MADLPPETGEKTITADSILRWKNREVNGKEE